MESDDEAEQLGIPGAWVSTELDLDLSLPHFTTPGSPPAGLLLGSPLRPSPVSPPTKSPPPRSPAQSTMSRSSMNHLDRVVQFHRRVSNSLFSSQDSRTSRPAFIGQKFPKVTIAPIDTTPQSVPSLLEGSSVTTTPSLSPQIKDLPPILPPLQFPSSSLPDDSLSISSRVTRLSFGPSIPTFSPDAQFDSASTSESLFDLSWDFSSPVYQHAHLRRSSSRISSDSSVIDAFPSSASIKPIPSIPSISSGFQLNNLPTPSPSTPLFGPSSYAYFTAGDVPVSSFFETLPAISATPSTASFGNNFVPSAQQAHQDMLRMGNPPASGRRARIVVRDQAYRGGEVGAPYASEPWAYACHTLPYEAGWRPHAYVDNSGYSLRGKRSASPDVEVDPGVIGVQSLKEIEQGGKEKPRKSPSSNLMKRLVRGRISRFLDFRTARKEDLRPSVPSSLTDAGFAGRGRNVYPLTPYPGSEDGTVTAGISPPNTPKPRVRGRTTKRFSLPRPLSLFVVPKPRMDFEHFRSRSQEPSPLDESFEAISSPRLSVGPIAGSREELAYPNLSSSVPTVALVEKDSDAKNRRRRSWFNLTSPSGGLASRLVSRVDS